MLRTAKRWLTPGAALVAALASIVTCAPRWQVTADLPALRRAPSDTVYRYTVESDHQPVVDIGAAEDRPRVESDRRVVEGLKSKSRALYLAFPGEEFMGASIAGDCDEAGCSDCNPPDGAFVRVSAPEVFPLWTLRDERSLTFDTFKYGVTLDVTLDGVDLAATDSFKSGDAIAVRFELSPSSSHDLELVKQVRFTHTTGNAYTVTASLEERRANNGSLETFESAQWRIAAILEGVCDAAPCSAPATRKLKIARISGTAVGDGGAR